MPGGSAAVKNPYGSVVPRAATRWLSSAVTVTSTPPMGCAMESTTSQPNAPAPGGRGIVKPGAASEAL
ncbi:hypothetical protein GCM10010398_57650 [Streptomyces fimbriatus]